MLTNNILFIIFIIFFIYTSGSLLFHLELKYYRSVCLSVCLSDTALFDDLKKKVKKKNIQFIFYF